jgi:hypothetical protein
VNAGDWVREESDTASSSSAVAAVGSPAIRHLATPSVAGGSWIRRLALAFLLMAAASGVLVALAGPADAASGQATDDAVGALVDYAAVPLTEIAGERPDQSLGTGRRAVPPVIATPAEMLPPADTAAGTRDPKPGAVNDRLPRALETDVGGLAAPVAAPVAAVVAAGRAVPGSGPIQKLTTAAAGARTSAAGSPASSIGAAIGGPDPSLVQTESVPAPLTLGADSAETTPPAAAQTGESAVRSGAGVARDSGLLTSAAHPDAPASLTDRTVVHPSAPDPPAGPPLPPLAPLSSAPCHAASCGTSAGGSGQGQGHGQGGKSPVATALSGSSVPVWTDARTTSAPSGNVVRGAQDPGTRPG